MNNQLYCGDNLAILRDTIKPQSIDLCYCDPPFNSNRDYYSSNRGKDKNDAGKDVAQDYQGFSDKFSWDDTTATLAQAIIDGNNHEIPAPTGYLLMGMIKSMPKSNLVAYLLFMTPRILAVHHCLKPQGSFYLHCDPTASHYLKIICDSIFCPPGGQFLNEIIWHYKTGGTSKKWFSKKHDVILFYSKSCDYTFNPTQQKSYLSHKYGFKNITIHQDSHGYYTNITTRDVWDIPALRGNQTETLGFPTQKPESLLERMIQASSHENDIIIDAFCGSGTSLAVAQRLNRQWIGIDLNPQAIALTATRLRHTHPIIYVEGKSD